MNLFRRCVGRGQPPDHFPVHLASTGKTADANLRARLWQVCILHVGQQLAPGRTKFLLKRIGRVFAEPRPLRFRNAGRHVLQKFKQLARGGILLRLARQLLDHQLHHDLGLCPTARDGLVHYGDVLIHELRHCPNPSDDVFAILHAERRHPVDGPVDSVVRPEKLAHSQDVHLHIPGIEIHLQVITQKVDAEAVLLRERPGGKFVRPREALFQVRPLLLAPLL